MQLDLNPNCKVPTKLVVAAPGHAYALATTLACFVHLSLIS